MNPDSKLSRSIWCVQEMRRLEEAGKGNSSRYSRVHALYLRINEVCLVDDLQTRRRKKEYKMRHLAYKFGVTVEDLIDA